LHRGEEEVNSVSTLAHPEEHGRSGARDDKVPCDGRSKQRVRNRNE
jgi:hypothetical protein